MSSPKRGDSPAPGSPTSERRFRLSEEEKAEVVRDSRRLIDEMRLTGELPANPDTLTTSEIEELRRVGRSQDEQARKAFAHLRPKENASDK